MLRYRFAEVGTWGDSRIWSWIQMERSWGFAAGICRRDSDLDSGGGILCCEAGIGMRTADVTETRTGF